MLLSMGFYQLSRLHYCFANSQIHSDKGYAKWVFIIMYTIGISLSIYLIVAGELAKGSDIFNAKCGINRQFEFYEYSLDLVTTNLPNVYTVIIGVCFILWDLFRLNLP